MHKHKPSNRRQEKSHDERRAERAMRQNRQRVLERAHRREWAQTEQ